MFTKVCNSCPSFVLAVCSFFSKPNTCEKLCKCMQQCRLCERHQKNAKFGKKKVTVGKSAQTFAWIWKKNKKLDSSVGEGFCTARDCWCEKNYRLKIF